MRVRQPLLSALVPFFVLAGLARLAHAQPCGDLPTQAAMNTCAYAEFRTEDARLNTTYAQLLQRLKDQPEIKSKLVAAQRAWVRFRDAECAFAGSKVEGGTLYPFIVAECRAYQTRQRATALGTYLKCEEGDLSCPVPAP